jgi:hypothetical protein
MDWLKRMIYPDDQDYCRKYSIPLNGRMKYVKWREKVHTCKLVKKQILGGMTCRGPRALLYPAMLKDVIRSKIVTP